ncbi:MAG TPA: hypothetical protein VIK58_05215 [Caldimonas sp.]|jgi:hypothetical protein
MPAPDLKRLFSGFLPSAAVDGSTPRSESLPPLARRRTLTWVRRLGERSRSEALAAARLDFDEALGDIVTPAALAIRSRIAVARSLHELWHFREEVFSLVACRHDQARAAGRLADLDLYFRRRDRS